MAWSNGLACFLFEKFVWNLFDYILHWLLSHINNFLPNHPFILLHDAHSYLLMDCLLLIMPPILSAFLSHPFTCLAYFQFPIPYAYTKISQRNEHLPHGFLLTDSPRGAAPNQPTFGQAALAFGTSIFGAFAAQGTVSGVSVFGRPSWVSPGVGAFG
ncbi:hypothetical protein PCANC_23984 [Puccinia coronata f. sp. avenae]|uniref:Uncharacterized protein n=1 Tax=Puccinia coronata f. sp. avenae TaxID=200324 RepID=A0A2N5TLP3_9BASI|nr:hypothetical protein PCANC_23984 [Puccinia coronata f. sp. avenae]